MLALDNWLFMVMAEGSMEKVISGKHYNRLCCV